MGVSISDKMSYVSWHLTKSWINDIDVEFSDPSEFWLVSQQHCCPAASKFHSDMSILTSNHVSLRHFKILWNDVVSDIKWALLLHFTRSSNKVSIIKYKQYICPSCRKDLYWLPIMYLTSFFNMVFPTTHSTTFTCQETVKIPFDLRGMPSPSCNINVGDFIMLKNVSSDDANFVITVDWKQHLQNYIHQHRPITAFWLVFSTFHT